MRIGSSANVTAYSQGGTTTSTGVYVTGLLEVDGMLSAAGGSAAESCGIRCNMLAVKNINSAAGGAVVLTEGTVIPEAAAQGCWQREMLQWSISQSWLLQAKGLQAAAAECGQGGASQTMAVLTVPPAVRGMTAPGFFLTAL